jgi:hypothetical protein
LSTITSKLQELASAAFGTADKIATMSEKTGFSTDQLQEMQYVGAKLDVELDTMVSGFTRLTKGMNSAQAGSGAAYDAFKQLHVEYADGNGKLRDANAVYREVIGALGKMTNETERDAVAMTLMGKSATDLNPIIKAGSEELSSLTEQAHNAGAVMSDETVAALDYTKDAFDALKLSATAFIGEALANIIGDSKTASETIADLLDEMSDTSEVLALIDKYRNLTSAIQNTNLSKKESAERNTELEQTKKSLIEASNGVITTLDIENGTFEKQVAALQNATQTQRDYIQYQLESVICENTGTEAKEKAADAGEKYADAQVCVSEAFNSVHPIGKPIIASYIFGDGLLSPYSLYNTSFSFTPYLTPFLFSRDQLPQ